MIVTLKCHLIRPACWRHDIFDIDIPLCQERGWRGTSAVCCKLRTWTFLHHLDMVSLLAGPWGLTWVRSNWLQWPLRAWVFLMYSCKCLITHNFSSFGYARNSTGLRWVPTQLCLTLSVITKVHLRSESSIFLIEKNLTVWHLCPLKRVNKRLTLKSTF